MPDASAGKQIQLPQAGVLVSFGSFNPPSLLLSAQAVTPDCMRELPVDTEGFSLLPRHKTGQKVPFFGVFFFFSPFGCEFLPQALLWESYRRRAAEETKIP